MVRIRLAPSPTGYPHVGTIYHALLDYSYARKTDGIFVIRIEDTDRNRFVADAEVRLYEAIDWFGLTEDESPRKGGPFGSYHQSERLGLYKKYAIELIEKDAAYYCFCTKERLDEVHTKQQENKQPTMYDRHCRNVSHDEVREHLASGDPYVVRLKVPEKKEIIVKDELRGEVKFDSSLIEDAVLLKSDGYPTYHLGNVVDDHLMEITHVVRGEEWLPSLPKHVLTYEYFGWTLPLFFHTPVLRNPDKSKLSKRQGHTNVRFYEEEGFLPEAVLNYLAHLGWSHPEGKEIFSLSEFIEKFDLKDLKAIGPIFDIEKLKWVNGEYIRMLSQEDVEKRLRDFYRNDNEVLQVLDTVNGKTLLELAKTRMRTLKEFKNLVIPIVAELTSEEKEAAQVFKNKLEAISDWNAENILAAIREVIKEEKIKGKMIYKIMTGYEQGLPLPESLALLGKKNTLRRLEYYVR